MNELKQKWSSLKNSERNLLLFGGLFIVITLLYFYVWSPYNQLINNYRQNILYTQDDIVWFGQINSHIEQLKSGSSTSSIGAFSGSFIDVVDKSIKQKNLNKYIVLLENSGGDKIVLQFSKVSFNKLIKWLGYIKTRYGMLVKNIDLQREGDSEFVNARIILKKS